MKVMIRDLKTGAKKSVPRQHARVLVLLGKAAYVSGGAAKPRAKRAPKRVKKGAKAEQVTAVTITTVPAESGTAGSEPLTVPPFLLATP